MSATFILLQLLPSVLSGIILILVNAEIVRNKKRKARREEEKEKEKRREELISQSLHILLRNLLTTRYDAAIQRGETTVQERKELEEVFNVYESLGKNGVIKSERDIFLDLPINVGGRHVS